MKKLSLILPVYCGWLALLLVVAPVLSDAAIARDPLPDYGAPQSGRGGGAGAYARFEPPQPPDAGAPFGRPRGGASRGLCPNVPIPLTALVPSTPLTTDTSTTTQEATVWALTLEAHPTLWFYVPYDLSSETPAEFTLLSADRSVVYRTMLTATGNTAGIVKVTLPPTAPALQPGSMYQWIFSVYCDADDPIFTRGWIQRTEATPSLTAALGQVRSPSETASVYAANGIWHDALTTLAEQRLTTPTSPDLNANWYSLLESAHLEAVADAPLVQPD